MVALATAIQEVLAFSRTLVVVPAWEGAFTGSDNWSCSTRIYRGRGTQTTSCLPLTARFETYYVCLTWRVELNRSAD